MLAYDVAVIGAGCFGAWCAHELLRQGRRVLLLDAYGPAHSRASSGGETRIIRMGYGADALYTRWSLGSLAEWKALAARSRRPLFRRSGMLWLAGARAEYVEQTERTLAALAIPHQRLSRDALAARFPQIALDDVEWALWEPGSGVLMARQAVQQLVAEDVRRGLDYRLAAVRPPRDSAHLDALTCADGTTIAADTFVFACGPWLPKLFPDVLEGRIVPSRQEIFFFAPPPGDAAFAAPDMPAWFHHPDLVYGLPDIEQRGFKLSIDRHGPAFDPDTGSRLASAEGLAEARAYLARRFPRLARAALTETRVCQYENTANGDFLIDTHPQWPNVWLVGGGSGHGFKHGPAVGAYVAQRVAGTNAAEARFSLAAKPPLRARTVY